MDPIGKSDLQVHWDTRVFFWQQSILAVESTTLTAIRLSLTWRLLFGTDGLSSLSSVLKILDFAGGKTMITKGSRGRGVHT